MWKNLPATQEQLDTLGVDSMTSASGVGLYTKTFNWDSDAAAVLNLSYRQEQVTKVTVNGTELIFNNITDSVDISKYLVQGENIVIVKTATTILNRSMAENEAFDYNSSQKHPGTRISEQDYGLKSASLSQYTKIALAKKDSLSTTLLEYLSALLAIKRWFISLMAIFCYEAARAK